MSLPELVIFKDRRQAALIDRNDDDLMTLACAGHRAAFATLVGRHSTRLVEFCIRMTGDRRTGEDVAQETWLQVWATRERYRPASKLEAFLFTIARNRCRNAQRARTRLRRVVADEPAIEAPVDTINAIASSSPMAASPPSAIDAILERERERRIHDAAEDLPPKLREAVLLRFVAGLDYPDISAAIGRNESTVRSRVFYGLKLMRERLEEAP